LASAEEKFGYFMQDGATPHTAKKTIFALCGGFGEFTAEDPIVRKGLWPPRFSDLKSCDFYLGENSKVLCMPTIHINWKL
jgi:hypothetical protein